MSYTGTITVIGTAEDNYLQSVKVSGFSELHVEKQIVGKTAEEAIAFFSSVFSLCPVSQSLCARLALTGVSPSPKVLEAFRLEWLLESLRYFVLDLGGSEYRKIGLPILAHISTERNKLLEENLEKKQAKEILQHLLGEARKLLIMNLPEGWIDHLKPGLDLDHPDSVEEIFSRLSDVNDSPDLIEFVFFGMDVHDFLETRSLTELLQDLLSPDRATRPALELTGAITRLRNDESVADLLGYYGNCSFVRVAARLRETLNLIDNWDRTDCEFALTEPHSSGLRMAAIQNARGTLIHAAQLNSEGRIGFYSILNPTEINLSSNSFEQSAIMLHAPSRQELKELLHLLCMSYDPCMQIQTEIVDA
jgi:hypothetical protein